MEQGYLFNGAFCKSKRYIACKFSKKLGHEVYYDQLLFEKACKDIRSILGKKVRYDIFEAMEYFQTKYFAHRIPWKYLMLYVDSFAYRDNYFRDAYVTFPESQLDESETAPFTFDHEDNITLFIDTHYNKALRDKYPTIAQLETYFYGERKKYASDPHVTIEIQSNPFIVIGTLDKTHINSMTTFYGTNNQIAAIPELEYEIWYFHEHS